jgi:hypothetical protein
VSPTQRCRCSNYGVVILSDNCLLTLPAAVSPRVWAVGCVFYVNTTNEPTGSGNRQLFTSNNEPIFCVSFEAVTCDSEIAKTLHRAVRRRDTTWCCRSAVVVMPSWSGSRSPRRMWTVLPWRWRHYDHSKRRELLVHYTLLFLVRLEFCSRSRPGVSDPLPARVCYVARGRMCKIL